MRLLGDRNVARRRERGVVTVIVLVAAAAGCGWLLQAAVDWARGAGVRKIELHVFPWNEAAINLYEASDSTAVVLWKGYDNPVDVLAAAAGSIECGDGLVLPWSCGRVVLRTRGLLSARSNGPYFSQY